MINQPPLHITVALLILSGLVTGCQPRTPAEKAKDSVQDAAHEVDQGLKRAGDRIEKAVK